jgi:hypothetical protein
MFIFEDPVAVDIVQSGSELTGLGCDAGLPDALTDQTTLEQWCAPLKGRIEGDQAWFGFDIPFYSFRAEVTVSRDASRMAGTFNDALGRSRSSSWLRLEGDELGLPGNGPPGPEWWLSDDYVFRLIESASPGSGFDPLRDYLVSYRHSWGLWGDLGAFYYTEIAGDEASAGPVLIGPVAPTNLAFPISMQLDHAAGRFVHAIVIDGRGIVSEFEVRPDWL